MEYRNCDLRYVELLHLIEIIKKIKLYCNIPIKKNNFYIKVEEEPTIITFRKVDYTLI